ncbi:hypothetical protein ABVF61_13965 [Roseibium sp. HPY-6]|uniref:hypothetical protein n=1 Tax=Roseibium sp. HPY-6 TaxID=3229852 RepID=UPI00338DA862
MLDYKNLPPVAGENSREYCRRLESVGHEEAFMRKALRFHFGMERFDFPSFFDDFELARLRHIELIHRLSPNRTDYSMIKKISGNLGVSQEHAKLWFEKYREKGELPDAGERALER